MKYLTKTVWILGLVSLFTDSASEMLYPVMPIYLKTIGFSVLLIGILEGIAEATAGFSKGYFGKLSDNTGKRNIFVQLGYSLSAISKPLMAFFVFPIWIFFVRTLDRFGKGVRTGARDAILSDEARPETKGKIFGFHRGMDTLGAVIGPSLALLYLYFHPENYKSLFYLAFIPGVLAIITSFFLKAKDKAVDSTKKIKTPFFSFLKYWKVSPVIYKQVVIGLLAFTLFNSSDVFLLLKVKQAGLSDVLVIGVYIFYNLIYAIFSLPIGMLADKIGFKKMLMLGMSLFAIVYFSMGLTNNFYVFIAMFFLYGIYAATNEGMAKAWVSNITDKNDTATAIGTFSGFQSICTMLASSLAGLIWFFWGATATFMVTAIAAALIIIYFSLIKNSVKQPA